MRAATTNRETTSQPQKLNECHARAQVLLLGVWMAHAAAEEAERNCCTCTASQAIAGVNHVVGDIAEAIESENPQIPSSMKRLAADCCAAGEQTIAARLDQRPANQ